MRRKSIELSGMGQAYETQCQKMLWYGIDNIHSKDFNEIEAQLTNYVTENDVDCTGAMFGCVLQHLYRIKIHSLEWWYARFPNERVIQIDI